MKTTFDIYWIFEGEEYTGYAAYNEATDHYNAFITFEPDVVGGNAGNPFDRLDADDLEGGEDELREIWEDLLSDAEASEDGRLNVTYSSLTE